MDLCTQQHRRAAVLTAAAFSAVVSAIAIAPAPLAGQSPQTPLRTDAEGRAPTPIVTTWHSPRTAQRHAQLSSASGLQRASAALPAARFSSTDDDPDGDMPRAHAFSPDGSVLLVVNRDSDNVTWIDVSARSVIATVDVGDFPTDISIAPDGSVAVVTNVFDNSVSILDVASPALLANVPISGQEPYAVEVSADSTLAVVGVINDAVNSAISVIDLASRSEARSIPTGSQGAIGGFGTPEVGIFGNIFTEFALSPDSTTLVLPDRDNAQVALYDVRSGIQTAVLATPTLPTSVDIDSSGGVAVVSHEGSAQAITQINLSTGALLGATIPVSQQLRNQVIKLTPSGTHAIVAVLNAVIFVELATGVEDSPLATGTVGDIGISFDGSFAFVSNFNARVLDLATRSLIRTVTAEAGSNVAMSPVAQIAVQLNNRFRENVVFFDADGANASLLGSVQSGAPFEGDATRSLAVSPDGSTIVACNIISANVAIIDAATETVRAWVDTGDRCWDAAITPDSAFAVVTNTDASTVSIIDLATDTRVANLSVPTRPTEVVISPDSSTAYVTTVAGTDRLAIINLNGAASSVAASIPTGQLGTTLYSYNVSSGIALSPDGATLAVCVSFSDELLLIDTASRSVSARVPVGDFPIRVSFSPDGLVAYVAQSFSDNLAVVAVSGATSSLIATIPNIERPLQVTVDASGAFTYVGSFDFTAPSLIVIDNQSLSEVTRVPLTSRPRSQHYSAADDTLYVALTDGELLRIRAAGASTALIDSTPLIGGPADLAFSETLRRAYTAQPEAVDGVDVVSFGGLFETYGSGTPGTAAVTPQIEGLGVPSCSQTVDLQTNSGLPAARGTYLVGLAQTSFTLFGAELLVLPFVDFPHTLDGNGEFSFPLVLGPDPGLLGVNVFFQGVYADAGSAGGFAATPGLAMQIR